MNNQTRGFLGLGNVALAFKENFFVDVAFIQLQLYNKKALNPFQHIYAGLFRMRGCSMAFKFGEGGN